MVGTFFGFFLWIMSYFWGLFFHVVMGKNLIFTFFYTKQISKVPTNISRIDRNLRVFDTRHISHNKINYISIYSGVFSTGATGAIAPVILRKRLIAPAVSTRNGKILLTLSTRNIKILNTPLCGNSLTCILTYLLTYVI